MDSRTDLKQSIQNLLFNLKFQEQKYKENLRSTKELIENEVQSLVYALESRMKWLLSCADSVYNQNISTLSQRISSAETTLRELAKEREIDITSDNDDADKQTDIVAKQIASLDQLNSMSFVRNKNELSDLISSYGHIVVDLNDTADGSSITGGLGATKKRSDNFSISSFGKNNSADKSNMFLQCNGIFSSASNKDAYAHSTTLSDDNNGDKRIKTLPNTFTNKCSDGNTALSWLSTCDMSNLSLTDNSKQCIDDNGNENNVWLRPGDESAVSISTDQDMESNIIPACLQETDFDKSKWICKETSTADIANSASIEDVISTVSILTKNPHSNKKNYLEDLTLSELVKHSINSTKLFTNNDFLYQHKGEEVEGDGSAITPSTSDIDYLNKILDAPQYKFLLAQTILQKYGGNLKRKFRGDISENGGKKKMDKNG